jgi:hypothetical protein
MEQSRLTKLKERREQISARISKLAATQHAQHRRDDTRRKIIAGAILLEAVERDRTSEKPSGIARWWDLEAAKLARPLDRRLFGLEQTPLAGTERSDA